MPVPIQFLRYDARKYLEDEGITLNRRFVSCLGGTAILQAWMLGTFIWAIRTFPRSTLHGNAVRQALVNLALDFEPVNSMNSLLVPADSRIKELKGLTGKRLVRNILVSVNEPGLKVAKKNRAMIFEKVTFRELPLIKIEPLLKNNVPNAAWPPHLTTED